MSGTILPTITHVGAQSIYSANGGGGGGSYPSNGVFSTLTVSSLITARSFQTSTIVLPAIAANQSTSVFAFPNSLNYAGLWSATATLADGTDPPKAAGALFSVAAVSDGGTNNYWSYATVANGSNNVYNLSMYTSGLANIPPSIYVDNPSGNVLLGALSFQQMG